MRNTEAILMENACKDFKKNQDYFLYKESRSRIKRDKSSGVVVRVFGWEHCGSQFKSALLQRPTPGIPLRHPNVVAKAM